ncbi:hypothetical protein OAA39_00355 [bacterium]|jgi:hypothetical protein|nr:hypothetical protein [bacterium]
MTIPLDPTMLAALLQSGPAASTAASAFPTMPVSAISQAPAQLAAQQAGGINNISSALSGMGATPSAASSPTTGGLSGLGGMSQPSSFGDRLAKVNAETPQHHALVASNAQYVPLEAPRTNPYAPTAPSSLFDMLKSMYGA